MATRNGSTFCACRQHAERTSRAPKARLRVSRNHEPTRYIRILLGARYRIDSGPRADPHGMMVQGGSWPFPFWHKCAPSPAGNVTSAPGGVTTFQSQV